MSRLAAQRLLALVLLLGAPARAVMPTKTARQEGKRFGLNSPVLFGATVSSQTAQKAVDAFNNRRGGIGPAGGAASGRPADPRWAAAAFLSESQDTLGVDPRQLELSRQNSGQGHHHALYQQVYKGLPVEFSRVKVHLDGSGRVLGASSNYRPRLDVDVRPSVSASVAAYAVRKDAGEEPRSAARLVLVPDPKTSLVRLAWKFTVNANGLWRYYVDAHSGELIMRYDDRRYVCDSGNEGTVRGEVYDIDPQHGAPIKRPFAHQRVFIKDASISVDTDAAGLFCSPTTGKVFTQLQGPYVRVANFRGASAHYDNALGIWQTVGTASARASSPHPYPNNANLLATVDLRNEPLAAGAVKVLPVFNTFDVGAVSGGEFGESSDITDDDQLTILDSTGNAVASYVGARGAFNGAAVPGAYYQIRLKSNDSGVHNGYDVLVSSFLTLPSPSTNGTAMSGAFDGNPGSFDWIPSSFNALGLRSEASLFYHLNKMHDYFIGNVDRSSIAALTPVTAMAYAGPNLTNAFYDPDYDNLFFGDVADGAVSDLFADDATVSHHEYTHYVVEKIWPIQNFGQAGAISEAVADYFSASSLDEPSIGAYVTQALGGSGALRELDCQTNPPCAKLGDNRSWSGEIHDDSLFVSQALWDLRRAHGQSCADNLVFQALLYFPESFDELQTALISAKAIGAAAACAGQADDIAAKFAAHGIPISVGANDPYDTARHNDGFETAVDISTISPVAATIFPAADIDFYAFGAGPGMINLELALPPDGYFFKGYQITLLDRNRRQVAQSAPPFDGFNTDSGFCNQDDCTTTQSKVKLSYFNSAPSQFFVEITGGPTVTGGSNSGVNSTTPYSLTAGFPRSGAVSASIVAAKLDGDTISFSVLVASFTQTQDYRFAYAQLRDQAQALVPATVTHKPAQAGDFLLFSSSQSAFGQISGTVQLAPGFNARFPSLGSVYLEVFAYDVMGSTVSLGLSAPINLTTNAGAVHAWNNVFNPARGDKTTVRYDVQSAGHLTMRLYTINGAFITTLFDDEVQPGKGSVDWFGRNNAGSVVASGIYLLQVTGPGISKTQKIAVVK